MSLVYPKIKPYLTEESIAYLEQRYSVPQLDSKVYLDLNEALEVEAKIEYDYNKRTYHPLTEDIPSNVIRDKVKEADLMNTLNAYAF